MDNTARTYKQLHREVTALRQQLTQFEAIAASLHDAVYVVDLEGRITYCNKAWTRLTGYRMEELLGRPSLECYAEEAVPVFLERRRCALAGTPVSPLLETTLVKRDGTRVPVELSVTNFVFDGRLSGRITVARDTTRREEEQFQGFLEGVPDATVVVDEDGMIVRINAQTEALFGYSRGDLLDQRVEILLPERFRAMHAVHRARYFREPRLRSMGIGLDLYGRRQDGHEFPVEISLSPLKTEEGVLVLGAIRDVTVRQQMEETLRQREELFRKAFEEGPLGMAIIDAAYRFMRVNTRLCRMLGYTESELMARTFIEVTHPEDIDTDVRLAARVFHGQIPYYHIEKRYLKKTGEVLWSHLSASVVRDVDGRPLYGLAMIEDITARKQAEETMRLEREKLRVTLTSIGDAVIATDTSGVITFINSVAEGLTGWPAHEAIGSPLDEVFRILHEHTRLPVDSPVPEVLRQRRIVELAPSVVLQARDGREMAVTDSGAPIQSRTGELYGAVLVFRDVSERNRMQDELFRTRKIESIGLLAGGIAHDFNNLLMVMMGNISLAKTSALDDQVVTLLSEAENACQRATSLTRQLLTFSKGGAPVRRTVSISELLQESTTFALSGSNVSADLAITGALWPVDADVGQLHQVIHNMVLNAAQAMPDGGIVRVQAENIVLGAGDVPALQPGHYVAIAVGDHGCGIPPDVLPNIFDPYFTTKVGGSGLGLATAYSIITKHEGYITVASKVGVGTTFCIYLPASEQVVAPTQARAETALSASGRILVMDDEEAIRNLLRAMLTGLGYRVDCVRDGTEAIALYESAKAAGQPFTAVILDLTIPGGMGGRAAIERLRAIDPQVKALVSSGYANDPVMADFQRYGFNGVIEKPYSTQSLQEALQRVL